MSETEIELYGKMSKLDAKQLSPEQKKLRIRYQKRKYDKNNKERKKEYDKTRRERNPEKEKERHRQYQQTAAGKKVHTISKWRTRGLQETKEELERIYNLYLTQELCNACDILLARTGNNCSSSACMDHCHTTHRFRHIVCNSCNVHDNWKNQFC